MIHRLLNPSKQSSFFLFGARGTGKSTFIEQQLLPSWGIQLKSDMHNQSQWHFKGVSYYDLLNDEVEEAFVSDPEQLRREIKALSVKPQWVIIDEIQKVPRLLDVIHSLIEREKIKFVLTGSSARKLKKMGANLLGGRAFEYAFFPFSFMELEDKFNLDLALNFGMLPGLLTFDNNEDKIKFLRSYIRTYIRVEVQIEQLLRKLDPFRNFLEIAAQMNGKILNFSKISNEVGVDIKTVQHYYLILEETYLGFRLPSFHRSIRKSQLLSSKFYFFDVGVKRALEHSLHSSLVPSTSYYGDTFEHFVILEFYKLNHCLELDYRMSYFSTKEGSEVDLILSRGRKIIFIEIKSAKKISLVEINKLKNIASGITSSCYYLSCDQSIQLVNGVKCMPWDLGIKEILEIN